MSTLRLTGTNLKNAIEVSQSRFRKSCGSGQSADEEHDGGGVEEGAGRVDGGLEVLCQSPVAVYPGEEALHDPTARLDGEANLIGPFAHDLNGDHSGRGDLLAGVAAVGKDLLDERKRAARGAQQRPVTIAVLDTRRMRIEPEAAPLGVDQRVALAPLDFLARIVAAGATSLGRLDALAFDNGAARDRP